MPDLSAVKETIPLRRFLRRASRLTEVPGDTATKIDLMLFDAFDIRGRHVEPVAASLAREADIVADLMRLRQVMRSTAWLVMPVDLPRVDLAKACLDAARFRKARLAHVVLDGRGEHEDGLVFHPIHNRLSQVVAAIGGRSVFRAYYDNGILPLSDRMPHEAVTVELILRHSGDGDIIGIRDGMLADVLASFDLTPLCDPARPLDVEPRRRARRNVS